MLRGAVQKHEKENARVLPKSSQDYFKSSPPEGQKSATQGTLPGYRNPLKPAASSALNGTRNFPAHSRVRAGAGVKRNASGLAKALDGSFDDDRGMQHLPIMVDEDMFGENDFDSDIDLDFEMPVAKSTVTYPKLPQAPQQAKAAAPKPPVYPTLPRQQQVRTAPSRDVGTFDSGIAAAMLPPPKGQTPKSSMDLPWSSSPVEHYSSIAGRFASKSCDATQRRMDQGAAPPSPKGRTLPWLSQAQTVDEDPSEDVMATAKPNLSKFRHAPTATPAAKPSKSAAYSWNTTASAVKEQQKQFREQGRKAAKKNEASEEGLQKAKSTKTKIAKVFLSEEQQHVLDLVTEQKKSVFFTGSAGTGKSVLLREIIASFRKKYQREPDRVAVTASTGLAACNVGGVTLHSFAGIGLGKEDATELVRKIKRNQKAKHRWLRTKVLIIDEVSMVDADLFDKLESIARQLRNNGRPFGGIQLVITGDFFQLPPVPDSGRIARFAFDAATWTTTIEHTIGLHHVFRQKDPIFAGMLNEMREGRLTPFSVEAFRKLSRPLSTEYDLEATELFPTRNEVDNANSQRLQHLQGDVRIFEARDGGTETDKARRDKTLSNCMAPDRITLKKGAQVMLIKNIDESLVNGSIGRVIGFMSEQMFDKYHENEDAFTSPDGTDSRNIKASIQSMGSGITTSREFPVVRFILADGTSRDLLCQPESWKVELPNGEVQASRLQVPLILAWALSIHKAQGQTLERVKVDLGKVFEKGQAYVALSRATSMAGLQVLRFDPKKVNAHERVRNFYSNLSRVELMEKNTKRMGDRGNGVRAEEYEKRFVEDGFD